MIVPGLVIHDGFLPEALHGDLLAHALRDRDRFAPARTSAQDDGLAEPGYRRALVHRDGLGQCKDAFRARVAEVLDEVFASLGVPIPPDYRFELELVAHGDGAFYKRHIDTHTQGIAARRAFNRVLSMVYYFHNRPKRFSGGELAVYAFGPAEDPAKVIEPQDNRLIAFSPIAMHEVLPVAVPGEAFEDSRFAVNCWINRPAT